ncbi:MAG TPA: DNA polymerase domain-containing protein [Anaerolineales bacterium]|nr:DNA polymerase domain-containing protein [Anaerolineales bacterium]
MTAELCGWVLAVYPDAVDGAVIWLLGEDGGRYRLTEPFKTTFYIAGEKDHLRGIRAYLSRRKTPPQMTFTQRRELYKGMLDVLAIQTANPIAQEKLFRWMQKTYRRIQYYDAKIPFSIRYGAGRGIFPMAKCRAVVDAQQTIQSIHVLEDRWEVTYDLPPLRALHIAPDNDPHHAVPKALHLQALEGNKEWEFVLEKPARLLRQLQAILNDYDPDVVLARWGDSWLFPYLNEQSEKSGFDFNPNRDKSKQPYTIQAMTFESYGSIYHRAAQTHLFGRWHIDPENSSMDMGFHFRLESAVELARVTCVSVQTAARNSPGSGFTAMQINEAMHRGILVPLHKRQTERYKTALQLNAADCGGLNYRPIIGLHRDVAEIDFFSMYPSIMMSWNISGETVGVVGERPFYVPDTRMPINQDEPGLVASVLRPLLYKRLTVKRALRKLERDAPQREKLQSMADALKWLGYVSFGYQGYKNNLFGNIQAHEAITAIGREMLVTAMETAHEMGFDVLAANVDSLFVHKAGCHRPKDFSPLMKEILFRTGLIIELEGVYEWLAFQPAKQNPYIGAANRYFGKFIDGSLKVRGLAQRRSDTPTWIADAERELMEFLAGVEDVSDMDASLQDAIDIVKRYCAELDAGCVPIKDLVCQTRLSRAPDQYKGNSTSAKAARQLAAAGKEVRVGQRVKFIYTHGTKTTIYAWDLPVEPDESFINKKRYKELLLRTAHQVLAPFGLAEDDLASLVHSSLRQLELWPEDNDWDALESEDELSLAEVLFIPYLPP